jgi:catechol 2,3-dioxygenase-like lactoylglutathione lyase family enzyme
MAPTMTGTRTTDRVTTAHGAASWVGPALALPDLVSPELQVDLGSRAREVCLPPARAIGIVNGLSPKVRKYTPEVNFSPKRVDIVSLFVEDVTVTVEFYRDTLGLQLVFEDTHSAVFKLDNLMINLRDLPEASEIVAPAVVASPEVGCRFLLALFVDDANAACAELIERGVVILNGPVDQPWGTRTACFSDPAGHIWEIVQDLG